MKKRNLWSKISVMYHSKHCHNSGCITSMKGEMLVKFELMLVKCEINTNNDKNGFFVLQNVKKWY